MRGAESAWQLCFSTGVHVVREVQQPKRQAGVLMYAADTVLFWWLGSEVAASRGSGHMWTCCCSQSSMFTQTHVEAPWLRLAAVE
jgi:hypothetical protein